MNIHIIINGTINKDTQEEVTQEEYEEFIDDFLELVENKKCVFSGGFNIFTDEEAIKYFND